MQACVGIYKGEIVWLQAPLISLDPRRQQLDGIDIMPFTDFRGILWADGF